MLLKYRKETNIVSFFYIIGCTYLDKNNKSDLWSLWSISTSIISDGPIKIKNHTVTC